MKCALLLSPSPAVLFDDGTLTFFLEVSNATNRKNPCCLDYDLEQGPEGDLVLGLKNDYWLPFLPAIGVLREFQ